MSRARSASDPTSPPGGHSEKVAGPSRAAALRPASPRENPSASSHARAGPSGQAVGAAGQASVQAGSSGAERYKDRSKVKRDTAWQRDSARRRDTPPSPLAYYPSHPSPALTQAALSALASAPPLTRPSYPYPFAHHSFPAGAQADTQTGTGRLNADESSGSSSTSHEGDGDDMDGASRVTPEVDEDIKRWAEAGVVGVDRKGKGKAKAVEVGGVDTLPGEILMQVSAAPSLLITLLMTGLWQSGHKRPLERLESQQDLVSIRLSPFVDSAVHQRHRPARIGRSRAHDPRHAPDVALYQLRPSYIPRRLGVIAHR